MTVSIRPGRASDAAALAEFAARKFRDTFAAKNRPEDIEIHLAGSYSPEKQLAELADPNITTLLAEVDGQLAGYARVRDDPVPPCVRGPAPIELGRFYVERHWHGQGVAQALMRAVVDAAVRRGAQTLWLGVWERNGRGRAFYQKVGFVDVGTQQFTLGTDVQSDRVLALDAGPATPRPDTVPIPPDPDTE